MSRPSVPVWSRPFAMSEDDWGGRTAIGRLVGGFAATVDLPDVLGCWPLANPRCKLGARTRYDLGRNERCILPFPVLDAFRLEHKVPELSASR